LVNIKINILRRTVSKTSKNELVSIFYLCFASVTLLSVVAHITVLRKTYK